MASNPFLDLPDVAPQQNAVRNDPSFLDKSLFNIATVPYTFEQNALEGLRDVGRGIKQTYLQGTEAVGLQPEGTTANYTQQTDMDRQAFKNDPAMKTFNQLNPISAGGGELAGNVAPYLAVPGGPVTAGGLTGLLQYIPENSGSRIQNTMVGAALGKLGDYAVKGGSKVINALIGGTEDVGAKALIQSGIKHDVPVFAADATNNGLIKGLTENLENIPILGTKGERAGQMGKAQLAADRLVDKAKTEMLNTNFGDAKSLGELVNLSNSKDPIRGKAAQSLLGDITNSGDDWQKIAETSGNLNAFKGKLAADKKFSGVAQVADQFGAVGKEKTLGAIDNAIIKANDSILPDKQLINTLEELKQGFLSKDLVYSQTRQARSKVGSLISDFYTGKNAITGSEGVGSLQSIKNAIDDDLNVFAQNNGPELKALWKDADNYYKANVAPYKDTQLAKALTNASPDEIYSKFITSGGIEGGKGTSRALKFYNALDDKGQSAVRYGMISNAYEKALNRDSGMFSPAKFASYLDNIGAAKAVFFKGNAKEELDGFRNLMRSVERSKIAVAKPETGVKVLPTLLTGGLGYGAHALGVSYGSLGLGAAGIYGLKKLLTTDSGRRLLLASSKLETSNPGMNKLIEKANKLIHRDITVEGLKSLNPSYNKETSPQIQPTNPSPQGRNPFMDLPAPPAQPQMAPQSSVNPELLDKIAQIESGGNPNARAQGSSASGLYQFTNPTWRDAVSRYGNETGVRLQDKNNPRAQRVIAERMLKDSAKELKTVLGREPQAAEIYLTHFLGLGGAKKLLASNPRQFAAAVLPEAARANRSVFFKEGRPLTVAEVYGNFNKKISSRKV